MTDTPHPTDPSPGFPPREALVGPSPSTDDPFWFLPDDVDRDPRTITGYHDFDPRDRASYPDDPHAMVELMAPSDDDFGQNEDQLVLAEELQMQIFRAMNDRTGYLPPRPLSPHDLKHGLESCLPGSFDEYTIWVPTQPAIIEQTSIGEYRDLVGEPILQFIVEYDNWRFPVNLTPDASEAGWGWCVGTVTKGAIWNAMDDSTQSRRLEGLLAQAGDPSEALNPPSILLNAANLLGVPLIGTETSPLPDDWTVTKCELTDEASTLFRPRYEATFVHGPTQIVVEVTPLEAEPVSDEDFEQLFDGSSPSPNALSGLDQFTDQSSGGVSNSRQENESPTPSADGDKTHDWTLHLPPERSLSAFDDAITDRFESPCSGERIYRLLRFVNRRDDLH